MRVLHVTVAVLASTSACLPLFDNSFVPVPAEPPPAQCCFEGEPEPEGEEGEGELGEGEGEGEGEGTGEVVACAIEVDCFTDEANEALGGIGMCIAGVCEPLSNAEWSVGRFQVALDLTGVEEPFVVDAPRYFVEVYAPTRGSGEALTCLDVIFGPFDPSFVVGPPYLGNGVPADANITGGASTLQATTDNPVLITTTAISGRQIVRFGIHENEDPAAVPRAIACIEVDFATGFVVEEFDDDLNDDPDVPFIGGVLVSPVP